MSFAVSEELNRLREMRHSYLKKAKEFSDKEGSYNKRSFEYFSDLAEREQYSIEKLETEYYPMMFV